ncbi:MAG TPA: hypothetical protein VGV10_05895 [Thermoleophilaceae bacterium]|nr:hypothetical protein [Thermoleophilaceae bacterium]
MGALLAQIDLPSLGREGPDDLRQLLRAFYVLFGLGFLVAVLGHITQSRALQAAGIAMVMFGTVAFMVAVGSSG